MTLYSDVLKSNASLPPSPPNALGQWGSLATATRTLGDKLGDFINIMDLGAVGDGVADDGPVIQTAMDTGRAIYFPHGTYRVVGSLQISATRCIMIGEAHKNKDAPTLQYDPTDTTTDEPLLTRDEGWLDKDARYTFENVDGVSVAGQSTVIATNMRFRANNKYGQAVSLHNVQGCYFENCSFYARLRGLTLGLQCFDNTVINCSALDDGALGVVGNTDPTKFDPVADNAYLRDYSWGFMGLGHAFFHGLNVNGFGTQVKFNAVGNALTGARLERAIQGVAIGAFPYPQYNGAPTTWPATGCSVSGVSNEAIQYGLFIDWAIATSVRGYTIIGSSQPTPQPINYGRAGIWITPKAEPSVTVEDIHANGYFEYGAVVNNSRVAVRRLTGGVSTGTPAAGVNTVLGQSTNATGTSDGPQYHLTNTRMFPNATSDPRGSLTAFHDLQLRGLTGLNVRDFGTGDGAGSPVFAKNLGGTVTPGDTATTVNVDFWTTVPAANAVLFGSATPVADVGSTLTPGTYYYAMTFLMPHGESGVDTAVSAQFKTVVVSADERVDIVATGTEANIKRRIYRGTATDRFDGYWELGQGVKTFSDDGNTPFHGTGMPPQRTAWTIESKAEEDANYQIIATPSWNTSVWVSSKATTGFTLNFSNAAGASDTVAWLLFRP